MLWLSLMPWKWEQMSLAQGQVSFQTLRNIIEEYIYSFNPFPSLAHNRSCLLSWLAYNKRYSKDWLCNPEEQQVHSSIRFCGRHNTSSQRPCVSRDRGGYVRLSAHSLTPQWLLETATDLKRASTEVPRLPPTFIFHDKQEWVLFILAGFWSSSSTSRSLAQGGIHS